MSKKEDFNFVIFGASGDLTKRKLIPALYHLYKNKQLGENFLITCIARRAYTTHSFVEELKEFYTSTFKDLDEVLWNKFMLKLDY